MIFVLAFANKPTVVAGTTPASPITHPPMERPS